MADTTLTPVPATPPAAPFIPNSYGGMDEGAEFSLREVLDTLTRRRWVILQAFLFVTLIGVVTIGMSAPVYTASSKLLIQPETNSIRIDTGNSIDSLIFPTGVQPVLTQVEILRSRRFRQQVAEDHPGVDLAGIRVRNQDDTNIITISAEHRDREMVAQACNVLATEYIKRSGLVGRNRLDSHAEFLRKRVEYSAEKLKVAEAALLAKQRKSRGAGYQEAQTAIVMAHQDLLADLRSATSILLTSGITLDTLKTELKDTPELLTETSTRPNPNYESRQQLLQEAEKERASLLIDFLPGSERVQDVEDRIATIEQQMEGVPPTLTTTTEVSNPEYKGLVIEIKQLQREHTADQARAKELQLHVDQQQPRVDDFGVDDVEREGLIRRRDSWVQENESFNKRLRDVEVMRQAVPTTATILETAVVPASPIRPQKAQGIALSMLIGLVLGVGFAFLQEFLDDRVNTSEDVERLSGLPTLGVVPTIREEQGRLLSGQDALSPITESYRSLRTAIHFMSVDTPLRSFLVTSSHSGEGKSVTSVNLAMAMALEGRQVILVDADLRRPSLHRMLSLKDAPGLSSVLAGQATLEEALQQTDVEGLQLLTSGPLPPNPAEMLNSDTMDGVIEGLHALADIVIFDTPPAIPVTDALVLATKVDGVVLVVEAGQAKKGAVRHARDLLMQTRARVLGVVLNKIDQSGKGYYYHYYYRGSYSRYGQGYGKGYGYGPGYGPGYGYGYGGPSGRLASGDEAADRQTESGRKSQSSDRLGDWE